MSMNITFKVSTYGMLINEHYTAESNISEKVPQIQTDENV